jgi:predicted RNase H-like nuclease (RuvC/YqgF family)
MSIPDERFTLNWYKTEVARLVNEIEALQQENERLKQERSDNRQYRKDAFAVIRIEHKNEIEKYKAELKQAKSTLTFLSGLIQQGRRLYPGETVAYEPHIGTAVVDTMLEVIREIEKLGV